MLFSWEALVVLLVLHWITGSLGICLGYHRLLTHRSLVVPKWLEYSLAIVGTLAIQGGPLSWVSGHRQHHSYTEDEIKDPYSSRRGFWWSHMGWIFYAPVVDHRKADYARYVSDMVKNPFYIWLEKYYLIFQVLLGCLLYTLRGNIFSKAWGGALCFMELLCVCWRFGIAHGLLIQLVINGGIATLGQRITPETYGGLLFLLMVRAGTIIIMPGRNVPRQGQKWWET